MEYTYKKRILFDFKYDRKSQTITEDRVLYGERYQRYSYSQQRKKEFFDTILVDEKQVESSAPSGR